MSRFIEGEPRAQSVLFPESLDEWITPDNPVRVVDVFVEELDLQEMGFERAMPAETGRPLSPGDAAEDLYLWVSQPYSVEPPARAGSATQSRARVVDGSADAGL